MNLIERAKESFGTALVSVLTRWERLESGTSFTLTDPEFIANPHPLYRELRENDPVHRSRLTGGYVFTRYDDVLALFRDARLSMDIRNAKVFPRVKRSAIAAGRSVDVFESPNMLGSDPPRHTRLRGLVSKAFTRRSIAAIEDRMIAIVDDLLDATKGHSEVEIISALASPLPIMVIAELLGVPAEDRDRFRHWSDEAIRSLGSAKMEDLRASVKAAEELSAYLEPIAEQRRREPRDDLLSGLLAAEEEGDRLSMREVFETVILLLVAGNETTAKLIGNGVLALLQNPDQLELLSEQPDLIDTAVDELLRFEGPVHVTVRTILEDFEFQGAKMKKGRQVMMALAAANRDPAHFEDPDRLDITRSDNPHLSLGHGVHFCLGASLARLEAKTTIGALVRRYPSMKLSTDEPIWGTNVILRGLTELRIRI